MAKLSTYIVFLLLFVICMPTSFFAQVNLGILAAPGKIDSLEKEFQKEIYASKPNHGKLVILYESIIKYYQSIDKLYNADQYLDKWEASLKQRAEPAEELLTYICGRSIQYALMGNEKAALLCLEKAIQLLEKNPIISTEGETEYLSTAIQVYDLLNMPAQSSARIKEYFKLIDYEPYTTNFENLKQPDRFLEFLDKDYDHAIDQNMLDKAQLNRQAAIAYLDLSQVAFESKDQLAAKVYSDALMLTDQLLQSKDDSVGQKDLYNIIEQSKLSKVGGPSKGNFPLRETQEILSLNHAILIEHLSTNDRLQTVVISPNEAHYIDMPEDDKFKSLLNTYIAGISDPNNTSWRSTSKALYQLLLQPIFNKIDMSNISRLLIASDSDLQGLPFETLLNDQDQFLVDNFSIDYISSMTALDQQMRWTQTISNQNMAVYTNENTTDAAAAGVTEIVKICKGTLMIGQNVSSAAFSQNAGQYNIVHVAIPGYFDIDEPQNSGLIFDDSAMEKDKLVFNDFKNIEWNSSLVVIPNFESGYTDANFNQGINYLIETFVQAKIPAMVAALWKVPNLQTKEIMVSFYQHLKKGTPKDVALQNAKKEYLKAHNNTNFAHPFYWSGFVLHGDPTFLNISSWTFYRPSVYTIFLALGLIVFLVMCWRLINDWLRK